MHFWDLVQSYKIPKYETYETIYGQIMIKKIDDSGEVWTFGEVSGNSNYEQYLIDTDGGLPIPEENK